ncbi:MAG TPA: cell wall-binding repeat-containing protein [Candidatus Limnocylindria bacterium]|nr:cell wall-binding repeat-containing protein [Candidatus Limnocylindria bacterium]
MSQRRTRFMLPLVAAMVFTMVLVPSASAETLLDQSQEQATASSSYIPNDEANAGLAQTFKAGLAGILHSIDLKLYKVNTPTAGLKVELHTGPPTGAVLATSDEVGADKVGTDPAGAWISFRFATPATLVAGTEYSLVLAPAAADTNSADPTYVWFRSGADAYAGGTAWAASTSAAPIPWLQLSPAVDFAFHTYVTTAAPTCDVALALVDATDLVDDELSVVAGQKFEAWGFDYPPLTAVTVTLTPTSGTAITQAVSTDAYGEFAVEMPALDAAKVGAWTATALPATGCPSTADAVTLVVRAARTVDRIFGADRFETAKKISAAWFAPATTDAAFIATGMRFPDALAGGPAAAWEGAPILLSTQTALPTPTRDELLRLKPATIYVLGGTGAVSAGVQTQLAALTRDGKATSVVRIGGADRYATAALISQTFFPKDAPAVMIATGRNYPDALAGAAAGARYGIPILLVTGDSIPAATAAELIRLNPDEIYVLGQTGAVTAGVQTQLAAYTSSKTPASVIRLGGATRYDTAVAISQHFFPAGLSPVFVATGVNFPDALAAGPLGRAVLLVPGTSVPINIANEVRRITPTDVHLLGGPLVVSDGVATTLKAVLP